MAEKDWNGTERRSGCPYVACREPEAAADQAVRKVFAILGVDVDKPEQIEEFRDDLRFGRIMRKAASRGLIAFVTVLAGGLALAIYAGIKMKLLEQ